MIRSIGGDEKGQSLVEVSVGFVLLLLITIIVFEAGLVFSTYVALLNAAREGSAYAATHPDLARPDTPLDDYKKIIQDEAATSGLDPNNLTIDRPEVNSGTKVGDPIKVKVQYQLVTFTSTIRLPFFGRLGLPDAWPINAEAYWPLQKELEPE